MIITKTKFLNYTRCRRHVALELIHNERLHSKLSLEDYITELENEKIQEMIPFMFEENEDGEIDLTKKENAQLMAMMEYYKEIEVITNDIFKSKFGGESIFSLSTFNQYKLEFDSGKNQYLCYVDVYNDNDDCINIIEVKATTSSSYMALKYGTKDEKEQLFIPDAKGVYRINYPSSTDEKVIKDFSKKYNNLMDRYHKCGKYIYDLAVQRYFHEQMEPDKKVNYYLAILNHEYVYDGYREDGKRVYRTDENGNDIITFLELNGLTKDLLPVVKDNLERLESNIELNDSSRTNFGKHCSLKCTDECKYKEICYKDLPKYNTSYNFLYFKHFEDQYGEKHNKYDLMNDGILRMEDVPSAWIVKPNHLIQYNSLMDKKPYIDKVKIRTMINQMKYPIYHLDFEGFPGPLPRFKGEKCYQQSVFEFSLHIEHEPGVCDEFKDNYVFLADTFGDEREALAKALVDNIDVSKGTMLAQNVSYEKGRIKELANLFPQYREHLLKINDMAFDLLYIVKNNKQLFLDLGFTESDAERINFYDYKLSGSYSIKKTLPLFVPSLSYSTLDVKNGTEAVVEYSRYDLVDEEELKAIKEALIVYCRQDTWAMVEILRKLREISDL